jgi:hypothetical protein
MAPETADPKDVPVEITILEIGAIFLYGVLFDLLDARAFYPKPPTLKNSPNIGISYINDYMQPFYTAFSPNSLRYSLAIFINVLLP